MTENRSKWTETRRESGGETIEIAEISFRDFAWVIDLLMGLFRAAVVHHGRVLEQPISLNGAFPLLDRLFSDLNGPFPRAP